MQEAMNLNPGMQVYLVSQPAGQQNEQPTYRNMRPRFAKQLIGLGVVHILSGVLCLIFQSVSLMKFVNLSGNNYVSEYFSLAVSGHGFWSGLLFLVTGIIGIAAGIRKTNCQVVAISIFSVISAVFATILVILATFSAYISIRELRRCVNTCSTATSLKVTTIVAMETMLGAMGILEGIISICSCIVCCLIGVCNCFHASPAQTQPLILSAEQQAAFMSNPAYLSNQLQTTVGFYPQQQTVQYNKQQPADDTYTVLNAEMILSLPCSEMDPSIYEEVNDYDYEIQ